MPEAPSERQDTAKVHEGPAGATPPSVEPPVTPVVMRRTASRPKRGTRAPAHASDAVAQTAVAAETARYRSIIDNAREGIFQSTADGKLTLVNDALVRLLGYTSKAELLAVKPPVILTHLHPDDAPAAMRGMFVGEDGEPFEVRMRKRSGAWIWVGLVAKLVPGPDGMMVEGFVQDMTSRRASTTANARLAAIIDAAEDAVVGLDLDDRVTDWNTGASRLFGYTREEMMGRRIADTLVPADRQDEHRRIHQTILRGESVPRYQAWRIHKDGRRISTSKAVSPVFGAKGDVVGSVSIEHDDTAERQAEDARIALELRDAESARLKALEGFRRTFISQASHELNTPLTPLRIHVEALGELPDITPAQREHLVVIERNLLRLASLVTDMLEASRLETGRFRLNVDAVPIGTLIDECVQGLAESATQAGVSLETGAVAQLVVEADSNRVNQVLTNLVANAISYTPEGGKVRLNAAVEDGEAVVRVVDTGVGLSADQIGQLFQPFSRPQEGSGRGPKGTGLGLFICRGIIEQHGGRIWAESKGPGAGSSFSFSLPLSHGDASAPASAP